MILVLIMRIRFAVLRSLALIAAVSCSRSWPSRWADMGTIYHGDERRAGRSNAGPDAQLLFTRPGARRVRRRGAAAPRSRRHRRGNVPAQGQRVSGKVLDYF